MGIFFNARNTTPADVGAYPQSQPAPGPSALQTAGSIADILLTGGLFHALNQRAIAQGLIRQQAQDRADASAMFKPGSVTTSAPAPVPDPNGGGANLFAGGQYGPAPTQTFGGDSVQMTAPQVPTAEQFAPVAARMASHGVDPSSFLSIIQSTQPKYQVINGQLVDTNRPGLDGKRIGVNLALGPNGEAYDSQDAGNIGKVFPSTDKGQIVLRDAQGNPTGIINLPGFAEAQGEVAGATEDAKQQATARYDLVDVPLANGQTIKIPRLAAARQLGRAGTAATGFGVSQAPNDKTYGDDMAKAAAARYQAVQSAGQQAPAKIAQYRELGRLFDGFNGNRLSPTGLEMARLGKSMGFNVDPQLGNKEAGVALANQIALTLRDPANGGGMPGSLSNSDRQFLTNMVPNLAQSDQGRRQLVDIYIAKAGRDQDVAKLARQWQQRYGRIDAPDGNGVTFDDQLQKWSEAHPLFGKH